MYSAFTSLCLYFLFLFISASACFHILLRRKRSVSSVVTVVSGRVVVIGSRSDGKFFSWCDSLYTVSQKNDTDVTRYRFNPHQPISVIFGRDVAERVCY